VPLVPNVGTPFTIDLHTQSYRFQKGHRIMVQVQSTWFPIIDRNPSRRDGGSPVVISARRIGFHLGTRSLTVLLAGPLPKGFDETRLS
jgi:predicted acyl esterase